MGQMLLKLLINAPGVVVVGGTERRGSPAMGQDLGALAGIEPLVATDDPRRVAGRGRESQTASLSAGTRR